MEPARRGRCSALGAARDRAPGRRRQRASRARRGRPASRRDVARPGRCWPAPRSGMAGRRSLGGRGPRRGRHAPARGGARTLPDERRALAARLRARLAVELYYPDRAGAEELSARAVDDARRVEATPRARGRAQRAPRRAVDAGATEERLEPATEMIAAAEAASDREGVLQGRNWRVVDLMELGPRRRAGRRDRRLRGAGRTASGSRTTAGTCRCGARRSRCSRAAGRGRRLGRRGARPGRAGRRPDGAVAGARPVARTRSSPRADRPGSIANGCTRRGRVNSAEPWAGGPAWRTRRAAGRNESARELLDTLTSVTRAL